ncbi:hypothetical protein Cpir12675_004515 [Ceratocystis pirilliformis]|uniref:Uncharacterized protein n=1 Tax=Ceratocystis pirilliformis TaxID=259994 RepID=A0ABR3YXR9_9PEZI
MADPISKRRRTSPRTSNQIRPETEVPNDADTAKNTDTNPAQTPKSPSKRPASFASPTKASLSRSNPEILARHSIAPSDTETNTSNGHSRPSNGLSQTHIAKSNGSSEEQTLGAVTAAAKPKRGSLFPSVAKSLARRLSERPRRSSSAKPSNPEDDAVDPFRGNTLRRSGAGLADTRIAEPDSEPELPPTPVQLGLDDPVVTTPSTEIHNSTSPSRRGRKRKQSESIISTTPSQLGQIAESHDEPRPENESNNPKSTQIEPNRAPFISPTRAKKAAAKQYAAKMAASGMQAKWTAPKTRSHRHTQDLIDPARGIVPRDAYWEKRELIEKLKREAALLQADLNFAKSENDRIRAEVLNQRETRVADEGNHTQGAQVLELLKSYILPPEKPAEPTLSQQMLYAALNTMSWLPFGDSITLPTLAQPASEPEPEIKSHKPIKMMADEEKPFLTLFTPLALESKIVLLEQKSTAEPLLMKHSIDVSSATNPGAFAAQIEMTVDSQKLVITDLSVPKIDIRAQAELGVFINTVLQTPRNRSLKNNICVISWAMAEWYRVATHRARVWCTLATELGNAESIRTLVKKTRSAKRPHRNMSMSDEQEAPQLSKTDLIAYMDKTAMDIPLVLPGNGEMMARIQWIIDFDWTGEAVSSASLMIGLPGKWQKADKRGTLPQISKLFNELVAGNNDVLAASRTIVSLLAGQSP